MVGLTQMVVVYLSGQCGAADAKAGKRISPHQNGQRVGMGNKEIFQCKQLEPLIGSLTHACKVKPRALFLRRLLDLHATSTELVGESIIRLNGACRLDITQ